MQTTYFFLKMLKIKKAVPDFFTIANLIMGCQAIVFAFDRNYHYAALCIGLAAVDRKSTRLNSSH